MAMPFQLMAAGARGEARVSTCARERVSPGSRLVTVARLCVAATLAHARRFPAEMSGVRLSVLIAPGARYLRHLW